MSNDPFATPSAPGGGIEWADLTGALLIITAHSLETGVQTAFGEKEAIRADVDVVDGDSYPDALIFPTLLISQLKKNTGGGKVLGRLGQGQAKPGQKPPWLLLEASEDDKKTALDWLNNQSLNQPAPAAGESKPPF